MNFVETFLAESRVARWARFGWVWPSCSIISQDWGSLIGKHVSSDTGRENYGLLGQDGAIIIADTSSTKIFNKDWRIRAVGKKWQTNQMSHVWATWARACGQKRLEQIGTWQLHWVAMRFISGIRHSANISFIYVRFNIHAMWFETFQFTWSFRMFWGMGR